MAVSGNELKAQIRLEGESAFKKSVSNVNKDLTQLGAESKKVAAEFDGQANSAEALAAKQDVLTRSLEAAEQKAQLYATRVKELEQQQKTIASSTDQYRNALKEAQSALSGMDKGTEAYEKQAKAVDDLARKVQLGEQNQSRAAALADKYRVEQTKAETAVAHLNKEVDRNAEYMKEAEQAADGCATSIDEYGRKTKTAANESKGLGQAAQVALGNLASAAISKLKNAAVDAIKQIINVGSSFEQAMSNVEAISGATGSELTAIADKAKELGSSTKFTATEVAEGFKYMSLAGWDTHQMLDSIDGVVNLAAASEMSLGEASDMVTDYLSAFGLAASDAGKMVDEMVYAQSHSNTSTKQLGEAFGNSAANMNAAGQSMETTTAILEAMANQGTKGAQAGTALAAVMRDITQKMEDGAIKIGDTTVQVMDQEGNFRDLVDILADVEAATNGMGTAQKASALSSTFTARSIKAVNQVLNEGVDSVKGYKEQLEGADGAAANAAATMQDNFAGSVTEFNSALEGLGVAIFEKISEPLTGIVDTATNGLSALTDFLNPPKSELDKYLSGVLDDIKETKETLDGIDQIELTAKTNIAEVESYRKVLEKATKDEELSEFEKYQLQAAIDALGDEIPELADAYDAERGAIDLTTESVDKLLDAYEKQIKMSAISEMLQDAYKVQQESKLQAEQAGDAYDAAARQLMEYGLSLDTVGRLATNTTDSVNDLAANLADPALGFGITSDKAKELITTLQESSHAAADANDAYLKASEHVGKLEKSIEKETGELSENNYAKKRNTEETEKNTEAEIEHFDISQAGYDIQARGSETLVKNTKATKENTEANKEAAEAIEERTAAQEQLGDVLGWIQENITDPLGGAVAEGAAAVAAAAVERMKASAEQERTALETTRQAYEDSYNSIKETLTNKLSLWDAFDGGADITVEEMLANLQSQTEGIKQYKQEMAEVIAEYGDELGPDLVNTLQNMGADAANTWHHMWLTMQQDDAPRLFADLGDQWAEGLDLADQIAKYCAGNLTAYQFATGQMGSTRIDWSGLRESVQEMTPELEAAISACQEAGVAIPEGLAEGLRSGETTTYDAVQLLTAQMRGTFEGLYEIAQTSGADIPEGLSDGIDGSAESYKEAIGQLTETLSQAGNKAGTAAAEEISTGLSDKTSEVETAAGDTAGAAADAAEKKKSDFTTAGSNSGSQYASGVKSQEATSNAAGRTVSQAALQGAKSQNSQFRDVGMNAAAAMAAGIRAGQSQAINAAVDMAVNAYKRAKAAIGQHSPTGIFKDELGKNIPLATAAGIRQYAQQPIKEAAGMARGTFEAAKYIGALENMNAQAELAVPTVNVDTSPIAQMIGGMPSVQNFNIYVTGSGNDEIVEKISREIKQVLRR